MKNWKFVSESACVSLHDCFITDVEQGEDLVFHFEGGIVVGANHPLNDTGRNRYTSTAAVILRGGRVLQGGDPDVLWGNATVLAFTFDQERRLAVMKITCCRPVGGNEWIFSCRQVDCCWDEFGGDCWHDPLT